MHFQHISVRGLGIIGGGAPLAFAAAAGGIQTLAMAGLGIGNLYPFLFLLFMHSLNPGGLGLGGNFFAQSMCIVPYCRSRSNQCCLFVITITGLRCPQRC